MSDHADARGPSGVPGALPSVVAADPSATPSVLLACPGLDHTHRGFETSAHECFEVLRHRTDLRIALVKGTSGRSPAERAVPTLTRFPTTPPWRSSRRASSSARSWRVKCQVNGSAIWL